MTPAPAKPAIVVEAPAAGPGEREQAHPDMAPPGEPKTRPVPRPPKPETAPEFEAPPAPAPPARTHAHRQRAQTRPKAQDSARAAGEHGATEPARQRPAAAADRPNPAPRAAHVEAAPGPQQRAPDRPRRDRAPPSVRIGQVNVIVEAPPPPRKSVQQRPADRPGKATFLRSL
jgi:hypothetical protein